MKRNWLTCFLGTLLCLPTLWAGQAQAAEDVLHRDIHEAITTLHVAARNLNWSLIEGDIQVTTFHPDGSGPFPLVVLSHGRDSKTRADVTRTRFEGAARYFVRKGFAVAVPTRLGYGPTASLGDPESDGQCQGARYDVALEASSSQIAATVERMQQEPWVDKTRVLLVGQSVGGISTVAATSLKIPGLVASVNFAGGHGGNPESHPGNPCNDYALYKLYAQYGKTASVPMLWVYTENDLYFNSKHSREWAEAYNEAGGHAEYHLLPAFKENGHLLFSAGSDIWEPLLDTWLAQYGFTTPGTLSTPIATQFAPIDAIDKVPYLTQASRTDGYAKFLASDAPHKAFAINAQGNWGWASGTDDVLSRTLANCQKRSGLACKLYAVDRTVVW